MSWKIHWADDCNKEKNVVGHLVREQRLEIDSVNKAYSEVVQRHDSILRDRDRVVCALDGAKKELELKERAILEYDKENKQLKAIYDYKQLEWDKEKSDYEAAYNQVEVVHKEERSKWAKERKILEMKVEAREASIESLTKDLCDTQKEVNDLRGSMRIFECPDTNSNDLSLEEKYLESLRLKPEDEEYTMADLRRDIDHGNIKVEIVKTNMQAKRKKGK
jgi:hypothetical protein